MFSCSHCSTGWNRGSGVQWWCREELRTVLIPSYSVGPAERGSVRIFIQCIYEFSTLLDARIWVLVMGINGFHVTEMFANILGGGFSFFSGGVWRRAR